MAKIDSALDDIVKANRQAKKQGRTRNNAPKKRGNNTPRKARANTMPNRNRNNARNNRARTAITSRSRSINQLMPRDNGPTRLSVRNLDFAVNDKDMKELFSDFGGLKRAEVHYDRDGRSQGTAELTFLNKKAALAAKKQYNGVPLDGRPMEIEIIGDKFVPAMIRKSIADRRGPIRNRTGSPNKANRGRGRNGNSGNNKNGGKKGGRPKREEKKTPTAEELDKDLDSYLTAGAKKEEVAME